MQRRDRRRARLVGVDENVVALRIRRPEAERGAGREPALGHDLVEHGARVLVERARHRAEFRVVENGGKFAVQFPGREERRPVDVIDQFRDRIIGERLAAEEGRLRRHISARPVELGRIAARGGKRQAHFVGLRARVRGGELAIFAAQLGDIGALGLARHQRLRHADRAAGVVHIDRLAALVVRMDFHRRVHAAGGGAADQQRQLEALPLHLGRHVAHLVERGRDQAGQPDDVGLLGRARSPESSPPAP